MTIEILDIASKELDDAYEYYENIYSGLGSKFIEEFESCLKRISNNPEAWQAFSQYTRRCLFNKFPFSIIYNIRQDSILIIAIACNHRAPFYWISRMEN